MTEPGTGDARRGLWRLVSARLRILGWVVLLLALAGTAALLLQRRVLIERLDDEIERGLVQEAEEVRVLAAGRNEPGPDWPERVEAMVATAEQVLSG